MARKSSGVVRVPVGAYAPDYSPGSKRRRQEAERAQMAKTSAASSENWRQIQKDLALSWGVAPEDVDLFLDDPVTYRLMMDERERAADEKARIAVEGGAA